MTTADRTLTALVLALVFSAPLVRPAWRAMDPRAANLLRACESLRAREQVDPWGEPWIYTPLDLGGLLAPSTKVEPTMFEVGSAGPDRSVGTADDLPKIWHANGTPRTGFVVTVETYWPYPGMDAPTGSYRSSPSVPVALALMLLLTRWMSGATRPRASLAGRATVACALAVVPTGTTLIVFAVTGVLMPGLSAQPVGLLSPAVGVIGSVYLLLAAAIFAHRELHHLQKIEAAERSSATGDVPDRDRVR